MYLRKIVSKRDYVSMSEPIVKSFYGKNLYDLVFWDDYYMDYGDPSYYDFSMKYNPKDD